MPESYLENETKFGFFGKLPINGDFIHRNLPNHFIHRWDNWLQENLSAYQEQFQNNWLQHYLTSPIWRYFIAPSVIDNYAYIGILAPSVDSVGRYFPMTIAAPILPNKVAPIFSAAFQSIYTDLESVFLKYLNADNGNINMLCADLDIQSAALMGLQNKQEIDDLPESLDSHRFILSDQFDISDALSSLWLMQIMKQSTGSTLWWSNGSQALKPSLLINKGLPNKQQFVAMLSDFENNDHWRHKYLAVPVISELNAPKPITTPPKTPDLVEDPVLKTVPSQEPQTITDSSHITNTGVDNTYLDDSLLGINDASAVTSHEILSTIGGSSPQDRQTTSPSLTYNAVGFCDIGNKRKENQDAILLHKNRALWVVADGMGGHSSGDKASRAITEELSTIELQGDLFANIEQVSRILNKVNREILDFAQNQRTTCGSTVVLLIQNQNQCAFLWAGDSRLYLQRQLGLAQLTKDHSMFNLYEESGLPTENIQNNAITRAIGVDEKLDIEVGYHQLQPGDRFLLCSDGLYETLSLQQINEGLSKRTPDDAANFIKQLVLSGEAKDNLSGVFLWY